MTNTEWLRSRALIRVVDGPVGHRTESLEALRASQWCDVFEKLMRNRLLVGAFRYGPLGEQRGYDNIGSAMHRLKLYLETGNTEHLVDVANLCLVEFVTSTHPNKHFDAGDDNVEHVKPTVRY